MVSTAVIAKEVAYRYLREIYPEDDHIRPLTASLSNGVWHVRGHLPEGYAGGVAEIQLCQSNGRVLTIFHGQ